MTTPPTPAEMPKPDLVRCVDGKCFHCYEVTAEQPTTSIERAYIEQHARAEKAEAHHKQSNAAVLLAQEIIAQHEVKRDELAARVKQLQAENEALIEYWPRRYGETRLENERLREALERYGQHLPTCEYDTPCDCGFNAALHPTTKGDEDE